MKMKTSGTAVVTAGGDLSQNCKSSGWIRKMMDLFFAG